MAKSIKEVNIEWEIEYLDGPVSDELVKIHKIKEEATVVSWETTEITEANNQFTEKCSLPGHERVHTDEKPFKSAKPFNCNQCESSFTLRRSMVNHMKIHTGEKRFKCDQCNATFRYKISLMAHQITHTGEKPFKWKQCSTEYSKE